MTERLNNTTASDPRETMKICQEMLPKLDDSFRVYMEYGTNYGDADQRIEVQRWYVATRQQLLDIFILAQRQLAQPDASPTPSPGSVSRVDVPAPNPL